MIGKSLAHYEVAALIGEGGMGRVFRARDTRLGRDVALKLLPAEFVDDRDRLARFEREARTLAQLQHPNIASIYGFEQVDEHRFLVMELAEGQDLAARLKAGPLSTGTALEIAGQIAGGLAAAHQHGIIHRDLKPANVMLGSDGQVKILDFGLAKAADPAGEGKNPATSLSPTLTVAATAAGIIMGTAAYMSPEQARGKPVDTRSDIWAFGCLLYEMITGHRLFEGETVSDLLAAVLKTDPDWDRLPVDTPRGIRRLLRRCLQRDPERRLHHMADARLEIAESLEEPEDVATVPVPATGGAGRVVGAAIVAAVALLLGLVGGWLLKGPGTAELPRPLPFRLSVLPPEGTGLDMDTSPNAGVLSPDGRLIVFGAIGQESGEAQLYIRELAGGTPRALPGTEDAQYPFWSPGSRWVGFFSLDSGLLKKIRADGGPPVRICEAINGKGGSWSPDGTILFAPTFGSPIHRVDAKGGEPQAVTVMDAARHNSHRHPRFLEDGRHFIFFARSNEPDEPGAVMLGSLDSTESRELLRSNTQAEAASGYLLLEQDRVIQARAFDMDILTLTGEPEPLAQGVAKSAGASFTGFSSGGGHLAFNVHGDAAQGTLTIRDRDGNDVRTLGEPGHFLAVLPSPDGRRAILSMEEGSGGSLELWLQDLQTGLRTRFTTEAGDQLSPAWAPDGQAVLYASNHERGQFAIYQRVVGHIGRPEKVLEAETSLFPMAITPDSDEMIYIMSVEGASLVMRVPLAAADAEPRQVLEVKGFLRSVVLSPDGRYLAYTSDESGRGEVYVTDFPDATRRWLVSSGGGLGPIWSARGDHLLFLQGQDQVMASPVTVRDGEVAVGVAELLIAARVPTGVERGSRAALLDAGDRILAIQYPESLANSHIGLVLNWREALRDRE